MKHHYSYAQYLLITCHEIFTKPVSHSYRAEIEDDEDVPLGTASWGKILHLPSGVYEVFVSAWGRELILAFKKEGRGSQGFIRVVNLRPDQHQYQDLLVIIRELSSILQYVLRKHKGYFHRISFTASEPEKIPLYTRLAQRIAQQTGGVLRMEDVADGIFEIDLPRTP